MSTRATILPSSGSAVVKAVSSGDTVTLLGRAASPNAPPPEVLFTFERVSAPRVASKGNNNVDEPGAFPSREWLRTLVVGKTVKFQTRKQGATAGDRVYGFLFIPNPDAPSDIWNIAVESVRKGLSTPKLYGGAGGEAKEGAEPAESEDPEGEEYIRQLEGAYNSAKNEGLGIHAVNPPPLVRRVRNAVDDFLPTDLVHLAMSKKQKIKVVLEYIFDGSRFRCHVVDDSPVFAGFQYCNFTLILAGVNCPRVGNPRTDPPTPGEPFGQEARVFVEQRLLQRELFLTLHGTDKSCSCIVGTVHHPKGSIAVELLKRGYGKVTDWTARMMDSLDLPALRVAENGAKRTNLGVWESYKPPQLTTASSVQGQVVEVLTSDTISVLPTGQDYDSESKLIKIALASVRSPKIGNERMGKPDDPYALEAKERLRQMTAGKQVKVEVHYERDIPLASGPERRAFATVSVSKYADVGKQLVSEGLATVQYHKEGEEKSPSYDELVIAEAEAKAAKKNVHSSNEYKKPTTNDLSDPKKAKAYSGSLIRAGNVKAVVEYVFNGSRFKLFIPTENCHVAFAADYIRCPQASPPATSTSASATSKKAEPFGDDAKRFAKMLIHQRSVEINVKGCTNGGVMTGQLFIGQGAQKRDYTLEILGAGLATLDERKLEYDEVPRLLVDAQTAAQNNKVGIWSVEQPKVAAAPVAKIKSKDQIMTVRLSEIRNGAHVFYHRVGDEAIKVMEESMKVFTKTHGTGGAPCDIKIGKVVAALFDDGSGKSWYRAKILGRKDKTKVSVIFLDHGNVGVVPIASHLRPLDLELGTVRVPPVAKEAVLALVHVRGLEDEDGVEAARVLQSTAWGRDLTLIKHCDIEGKAVVTIYDKSAYDVQQSDARSINEEILAAGYGRAGKKGEVDALVASMIDANSIIKLSAGLQVAQDEARKHRAGMWRYGDIGDEDPDEI